MSELTLRELDEQFAASADRQPMTVYCCLCPEWWADGTAAQARAAAAAHRLELHPELAKRRRIVRKRRSFSQAMTAEREAEIEEERRKRMRAMGIS